MVQHYIHRGLAKKNFKENTIKAFKFSFEKKYGVETDLHVTKDKQFVCFHDFTLKKKFKLNLKIKEVNYSILKKISKKNKAEIPLLKNLLKISKNKHPLLLEIKPLFFPEFFYCHKCITISNTNSCSHILENNIRFSGKLLRKFLSSGETPPNTLIRQEIFQIIKSHNSPFI